MKSSGFTLLELLVIVLLILFIIVLIALPVMLGSIKKSSILRVAEYYINAVELGIARSRLYNIPVADGTYNILESGSICLENIEANCSNKLIIEVVGKIPEQGTIEIKEGKIIDVNLNFDGKIVVKQGSKLVFDN